MKQKEALSKGALKKALIEALEKEVLSMNQMILMTIYCCKVTQSLYIKDISDF